MNRVEVTVSILEEDWRALVRSVSTAQTDASTKAWIRRRVAQMVQSRVNLEQRCDRKGDHARAASKATRYIRELIEDYGAEAVAQARRNLVGVRR